MADRWRPGLDLVTDGAPSAVSSLCPALVGRGAKGTSPTKTGGSVRLKARALPIKVGRPYPQSEIDMGKYFLGWILGIPAIVLVVAYFFFR